MVERTRFDASDDINIRTTAAFGRKEAYHGDQGFSGQAGRTDWLWSLYF